MSTELKEFVRASLEKEQDKSQIHHALKSAGWPEDEITNVLDAYADVDFPVPVPKRKPYLSAREAFLYLLMFATLYASAVSLGTLWFQFINTWLPDVITNPSGESNADAIRHATAALIITFPIFLFVSRILFRAIRRDPEKRGSKVRKWLTYVTMFVAAGVMIADLITLVSFLLSGDLTLRFIAKVTVVLAIAGVVFGYYLLDLRREEAQKNV